MPRPSLPTLRLALLVTLAAPLPALSDELDPLLLAQEGQPLQEAWKQCAASFSQPQLRTERAPERIAADAFRHCQSHEVKLSRFLAKRIGARKAQGVVAILRDQYQSELIAAVEELRRSE
jgi:hypothetical protein